MKLIDADKLISEVVDVFDGAAISIDDGMAVSEFIKIIEKQPVEETEKIGLTMCEVGDKITVEIESITTENVCRFSTDNGKPTKLYKLKGIPMYFSEDDFMKIVGDLK